MSDSRKVYFGLCWNWWGCDWLLRLHAHENTFHSRVSDVRICKSVWHSRLVKLRILLYFCTQSLEFSIVKMVNVVDLEVPVDLLFNFGVVLVVGRTIARGEFCELLVLPLQNLWNPF